MAPPALEAKPKMRPPEGQNKQKPKMFPPAPRAVRMAPLDSWWEFTGMNQVSWSELARLRQVLEHHAVRGFQAERSCLFSFRRQRRCPAAWLSSLRTRYARVAAGARFCCPTALLLEDKTRLRRFAPCSATKPKVSPSCQRKLVSLAEHSNAADPSLRWGDDQGPSVLEHQN